MQRGKLFPEQMGRTSFDRPGKVCRQGVGMSTDEEVYMDLLEEPV
jgi:hypothetical protein